VGIQFAAALAGLSRATAPRDRRIGAERARDALLDAIDKWDDELLPYDCLPERHRERAPHAPEIYFDGPEAKEVGALRRAVTRRLPWTRRNRKLRGSRSTSRPIRYWLYTAASDRSDSSRGLESSDREDVISLVFLAILVSSNLCRVFTPDEIFADHNGHHGANLNAGRYR
jgi:hypothetical protein